MTSPAAGDEVRIGQLHAIWRGAVCVVSIDRPEKLNAMARAFWTDPPELLGRLQGDGRTRVVVITGAGDRAFSVGGDVASFTELSTEEARRRFQHEAMGAFCAVEQCRLPVVAAVNGYALGGGCELVMACDMALTADSATFGLPEINLGLVPGFGVVRAASILGHRLAKLMVMTGERIGAQRALEIGLVQRIVPAAALMAETMALADRLANASPAALRAAKRLIDRSAQEAALEASVEAVTHLHSTAEAKAAAAAFMDERRSGRGGGPDVDKSPSDQ